MRVAGVIAEYNPFHRGHAHHLARAREITGADILVVVMSSLFTQRGEAALLSPAIRARMALENGADAVFALPVCWSVRDAEHFALGGVRLLQRLGTHVLAFGAEDVDISRLRAAAELLEAPPSTMIAALRRGLGTGRPYPAALSAAAEEAAQGTGRLLAFPNNTLAVSYLRAIRRLAAGMDAVPVPRQGAYHATALEAWPSATALRGAVERGDWQGARQAMPESAFVLLREEAAQGRLHLAGALDQALLYRLRAMTPEAWRALPDLSEGIEDRLRAAAGACASRERLLLTAKTRRYPYARLSRLCTHALLDITDETHAAQPLPEEPWLLGLRDSALPLLRQAKAHGVSIISKAADLRTAAPWFRAELRAYDLWALGCGLPAGLALRQGVVRL